MKKNKQLVPICFIAAAIIFIVILVFMCKPKWDEYNGENSKLIKNTLKLQENEAKAKMLESNEEEENIKLKSLKPIFESNVDSSNENLKVFGDMFEEIIKKAQQNGLLIRSIEYDMRPAADPIYNENPDGYNVCDLKFFFIGSYGQFQSFLNDMSKNFSYLTYFSSLNITAFESNTDYLLINTSITLYSKKSEQTKSHRSPLASGNKKKRK